MEIFLIIRILHGTIMMRFSKCNPIVVLLLQVLGEHSLHLNGCPYLSDNFFVNFYEYPLLMSYSELNVDSVIYICLEEDPVLVTPFDDFPTHGI